MVQRSPSISELSIEVGAIQKPSLKRRASTPGTPESPGAPPSSTVIGEPEWYRRVCLHPHSKPRIAWDLCSMTFLLYNAFIVPLRICFDITDYCPEGIWIFESVTDWFFVRAALFIFIPFALRSHTPMHSPTQVTDIFTNFFTAVMMEVELRGRFELVAVARPGLVAREYLKSWFLLDFFSSIPIDFFVSLSTYGCGYVPGEGVTHNSGAALVKILRVVKLVKLLKLVRLLKINKFIAELKDHYPIPEIAIKGVQCIAYVCFAGHVTACLWYLVGRLSYTMEIERMSALNLTYSEWAAEIKTVSWLQGSHLSPANPLDRGLFWSELGPPYVASIYWAFTTMTSTGYGDLIPSSESERAFAVVAMILGTSVFGYVIGSMTAILTTQQNVDGGMEMKMTALNAYMADRNIPHQLAVRVRKHFRYYWSRALISSDDDSTLLNSLSYGLREEILHFLYKNTIETHPLLKRWSRAQDGFVEMLLRVTTPLNVSADEFILQQGKPAADMFFILSGKVSVLYRANTNTLDDNPQNNLALTRSRTKHRRYGDEIATLSDGEYFGEIAILDKCLTQHDMTGEISAAGGRAMSKRVRGLSRNIMEAAKQAQERAEEERRHAEADVLLLPGSKAFLRTASIMAKTEVELLTLKDHDLVELMAIYTRIRLEMHATARQRLLHTEEIDAHARTSTGRWESVRKAVGGQAELRQSELTEKKRSERKSEEGEEGLYSPTSAASTSEEEPPAKYVARLLDEFEAQQAKQFALQQKQLRSLRESLSPFLSQQGGEAALVVNGSEGGKGMSPSTPEVGGWV